MARNSPTFETAANRGQVQEDKPLRGESWSVHGPLDWAFDHNEPATPEDELDAGIFEHAQNSGNKKANKLRLVFGLV